MSPKTATALFTLFLLLIGTSCTEEQNLDQFEELQVEPLVESSLFYLRTTEEVINVFGGAGPVYEQIFEFDAFSQEFVDDRIQEGTIFYNIENTTSKPMLLEVDFRDEGGNLLYSESFQVLPMELLERQVFYGPGGNDLATLSQTTELLVRVANLGDSVSESPEPSPSLIFRSRFTVRLRLL